MITTVTVQDMLKAQDAEMLLVAYSSARGIAKKITYNPGRGVYVVSAEIHGEKSRIAFSQVEAAVDEYNRLGL